MKDLVDAATVKGDDFERPVEWTRVRGRRRTERRARLI